MKNGCLIEALPITCVNKVEYLENTCLHRTAGTEGTNDKASSLWPALVRSQRYFITFQHDLKRPQIFVLPFASCDSNLVFTVLPGSGTNCIELQGTGYFTRPKMENVKVEFQNQSR